MRFPLGAPFTFPAGRRSPAVPPCEARRISEDMQQFHRSHPDTDLSDHYSWEDVLDTETDGYLDE